MSKNKIWNWIKDTGAWFMLIPVGCILFLLACVVAPIDNFYSQNVHAAGLGWHILGWLFLVGTVTYFSMGKEVSTAGIILGGFFLVLSFCAFAGFNFSYA